MKIFKNDDFGYKRITVDRPLKLRFEVTEESLVALGSSVAVKKALGEPEKLVIALKPLLGSKAAGAASEIEEMSLAEVIPSVNGEYGAVCQPRTRSCSGGWFVAVAEDPELGEIALVND